MARVRPLTPERLVRSPSFERLTELTAYLASFPVFPSDEETTKAHCRLRNLYKKHDFLAPTSSQTSTHDSMGMPIYDVKGALKRSVDRYLCEAEKFADCFSAPMVLDVLHIVEIEFRRQIQRRRQLVAEYESIDHEALSEGLTSLQSRLDASRHRIRFSRTKAALRYAEKDERSTQKRIRALLRTPSRLEYNVELSGSVVARLGLFVRDLRKKLMPKSIRCTIRTSEIDANPEIVTRNARPDFLKKLKKTKQVSFNERPVRIQAEDSDLSYDNECLRTSIDIRQRAAFKRSSDVYRRGKWADSTGCGFIDTSGYTLEATEWQSKLEKMSAPQDEELLSPMSFPAALVVYADAAAQETADAEHDSPRKEYQTPPNSPESDNEVKLGEVQILKILPSEPSHANSVSPSPYGEYRRLSDEFYTRHYQPSQPDGIFTTLRKIRLMLRN